MSAVPVVYVDTSALAAPLLEQLETDALIAWLDETPDALGSSDLLETELRRVVIREDLNQEDVTRLLEGAGIASFDRAVYRSAGLLPMPACEPWTCCTGKQRCGLTWRPS